MDEVTLEIAAPPERLWSLITDVTNMGRWSPECHRCEWLGDANGPAVGAKFKGWNTRGLMRWSTVSTVTSADEPRLFEWQVDQSGMKWSYRFEPAADGSTTTVTESREAVADLPAYVKLAYKLRLLGKDPDAIVVNGMRETLQRLKAAAEGGS